MSDAHKLRNAAMAARAKREAEEAAGPEDHRDGKQADRPGEGVAPIG